MMTMMMMINRWMNTFIIICEELQIMSAHCCTEYDIVNHHFSGQTTKTNTDPFFNNTQTFFG